MSTARVRARVLEGGDGYICIRLLNRRGDLLEMVSLNEWNQLIEQVNRLLLAAFVRRMDNADIVYRVTIPAPPLEELETGDEE